MPVCIDIYTSIPMHTLAHKFGSQVSWTVPAETAGSAEYRARIWRQVDRHGVHSCGHAQRGEGRCRAEGERGRWMEELEQALYDVDVEFKSDSLFRDVLSSQTRRRLVLGVLPLAASVYVVCAIFGAVYVTERANTCEFCACHRWRCIVGAPDGREKDIARSLYR